jgi:hypothetical protein
MGYSTTFTGELKFKTEPTAKQLAHLKTFLSKDRREIGFENNADVYESDDEYWYHIDLELLDDFSGLKWNGAEKTYGLHHIVNFLTRQMRKKWKDFELTGQLSAQGEEAEDRWVLVMEKGIAKKRKLKIDAVEVECPNCGEKSKKVICYHCEQEFILEKK